MPSFLKKSSSGARELAGTWKCLEARVSTSWVVWSIVRMDRSIYHHRDRNENSDGLCKRISSDVEMACPHESVIALFITKYLTAISRRVFWRQGEVHDGRPACNSITGFGQTSRTVSRPLRGCYPLLG